MWSSVVIRVVLYENMWLTAAGNSSKRGITNKKFIK